MRRLLLATLAIFFSAGAASVLSFFVVSEARSQQSSDEQESATPYHQLVDNSSASRFKAPGWKTESSLSGFYGDDYAVAASSDNAAQFTVNIPSTDHYTIYARWPGNSENNDQTRFGIDAASGTQWKQIDQREDGSYWVIVGVYEMKEGERSIWVAPEGNGRVIADAIMVVDDVLVAPNGRTASTANPDELTGETTTNSDATFSASGVIRNASPGDVVRVSRKHLGTRYGHNPCRIDAREDCSCHTKLVYKRFGWTLPDSPAKQWRMNAGKNFRQKSNLRRGDLVFHDLNRDGQLNDHFADHVSIYAGNGYIIHASSYYGKVVQRPMKYLQGFWGGKRYKLP